mmetsp:Transcript_89720/g.258642  ORF Transcript_89720/g.258642 Transcript_89720/m.258642 type:complete len:238 (+) Transcript_89720:81-794(+)
MAMAVMGAMPPVCAPRGPVLTLGMAARAGASRLGARPAGSGDGSSAGTKTQESLPDVSLEVFDSWRIREIVSNLCEKYAVPRAFLAMEGPDSLKLKARNGVSLKAVPLDSIARHWVNRELPIIVEDTDAQQYWWRDDALIHGPEEMRFFVVAPLMSSAYVCVGSVVLMDTRTRPGFGLKECDELVRSATAVMTVFRSVSATQDWFRLCLPSLAELPDTLDSEDEDDEIEPERDSSSG